MQDINKTILELHKDGIFYKVRHFTEDLWGGAIWSLNVSHDMENSKRKGIKEQDF